MSTYHEKPRPQLVTVLAAIPLFLSAGLAAQPDLYISEFDLEPSPPSKSAVVKTRIGIYNKGTSRANAFTVEWWAGENYSTPACTWRIEGLAPNGGRILTCSGYVYPSKYSRLLTAVKIDQSGEVTESDELNNTHTIEITVTQ